MKDNTFKCFGISKSDARSLLSSLLQDNHGVFVSIEGEQLLVDIVLRAEDNNIYFYDFSREVFEKLNQFIYAESDISLEETVFELLKLNHLTLATAESITGGQIASSFIKKNMGASNIILEGVITYSNEAKMNRLGVSKEILDRYTSVSIQTTYDMAKGLLQTSPADMVIATTGYASSVSPNEDAGLAFIAIGDRTRIDVFKNKFSGTRSEVIETTASASLFYLIKKLRKNDFYLDKNEI